MASPRFENVIKPLLKLASAHCFYCLRRGNAPWQACAWALFGTNARHPISTSSDYPDDAGREGPATPDLEPLCNAERMSGLPEPVSLGTSSKVGWTTVLQGALPAKLLSARM